MMNPTRSTRNSGSVSHLKPSARIDSCRPAHKLLLAALSLSAATALSAALPASAADQPYISVGTAKTKKTVIAFADIAQKTVLANETKTITETVNSDLEFMDLFKLIGKSAFLDKSTSVTPGSFKMTDWTSIGAEFVVKSALSRDGSNLVLEAYLYDATGNKTVLAKRYLAASADVKAMAHTLAGDIVHALTGMPSIFQTKIAMSCDRGGSKKEIHIMDFDGSNVKQITSHRSIAFAPAWNPDGTKIAYSLYTKGKNNIKNIDLYEYDFKTSTTRMLSNRKGINSGAAYSPDGKKILLTMSFLGNPEIFSFDPHTKTVDRVTQSMGFDVDPSWSPDGKSMAFVSSRSGMPMVYSMGIDGTKIQRLTYAGRYNATPSWSPQNNKIAFAGWLEKHFDIFIMNPDGTNIERLTKDQGNNEDPFFSPDGGFILFSSNRTGQSNIYVMNVDGTFVKRLTYGLGNCVSPKWSLPPAAATAAAPKS